jgi:uncharacterized protein (TIGR02186 family)
MRERSRQRWFCVLTLAALMFAAVSLPGLHRAVAQNAQKAEPLPDWGKQLRKQAQQDRKAAKQVPAKRAPAPPEANVGRESVEADVSTRTIAVTSAFTGTEIVVFGSVVNSRQPSAEAGTYDVIVVLEGMPTPLLVRRKSNVAGLWVNTDSVSFESAPSYYAIASTRPIEEIADPALLQRNAIGFDYARLAPAARSVIETQPGELKDYKEAVVRLKEKEGLFIERDYAVIFIGKSLFRSSIGLPANVPVGPMTARVYLFREGELLSTFQSRVRLERSGIELWLYHAAMHHPVYYGLAAVLIAGLAGFLASMPFRRKPAS